MLRNAVDGETRERETISSTTRSIGSIPSTVGRVRVVLVLVLQQLLWRGQLAVRAVFKAPVVVPREDDDVDGTVDGTVDVNLDVNLDLDVDLDVGTDVGTGTRTGIDGCDRIVVALVRTCTCTRTY